MGLEGWLWFVEFNFTSLEFLVLFYCTGTGYWVYSMCIWVYRYLYGYGHLRVCTSTGTCTQYGVDQYWHPQSLWGLWGFCRWSRWRARAELVLTVVWMGIFGDLLAFCTGANAFSGLRKTHGPNTYRVHCSLHFWFSQPVWPFIFYYFLLGWTGYAQTTLFWWVVAVGMTYARKTPTRIQNCRLRVSACRGQILRGTPGRDHVGFHAEEFSLFAFWYFFVYYFFYFRFSFIQFPNCQYSCVKSRQNWLLQI